MDDQLKLVSVVLQRMQKTLECTICLDLLQNPYTTKCGHSFCSECLERLFLEVKGCTRCPLCNSPTTKRSLTQNPKIVSFVKAVKKIILSIKQDFGIPENVKKSQSNELNGQQDSNPIEQLENKRVQRKRGQTVPFDAQINMLPRAVSNKGNKTILSEEAVQKNKAVKRKQITQQAPTTSNVLDNQNKSVEKVKNWLNKRCTVVAQVETAPQQCNLDIIEEMPTTTVISSQQSTVVFELSPNKCQLGSHLGIDQSDKGLCEHNKSTILVNKNIENIKTKPIIKIVPKTLNAALVKSTSEITKEQNAAGNMSKRKLTYETSVKPVAKIRKNIRFASEVKTQLLDNSKNAAVEVKRRTKKSPGWTAIDGTKRELRSQVRALNITGGEEKQNNVSRSEIISDKQIQTQDSIMVIDDGSQKSTINPLKRGHDSYAVRRKFSGKKRQRTTFMISSVDKTSKISETSTMFPAVQEDIVIAKPVRYDDLDDKVCDLQTDLCSIPSSERVNAQLEPIRLVELVEKQDSLPSTPHHLPCTSEICNNAVENNVNECTGENSKIPSNELRSISSSVLSKSPPKKNAVEPLENTRNAGTPEPYCVHFMPCDLFKSLKKFLLSHECHSSEKYMANPAASSHHGKADECDSSKGLPAAHDCTVKDTTLSQELPTITNTNTDLVNNSPSSSTASSLEYVASVNLDTLDCADKLMTNVTTETVISKGGKVLEVASALSSCSADEQNDVEFVNTNGPSQASVSILLEETKSLKIPPAKYDKNSGGSDDILNWEPVCAKASENIIPAGSISSFVGSSKQKHKQTKNITCGKRKFKGKNNESKKYKRIKAALDSSDSSDQEMINLTNSNKADENKYNLDSEELRDFQRFDENIMKFFNSQSEASEQGIECVNKNNKVKADIVRHFRENEKTDSYKCDNKRLNEIDSSDDEIPGTDNTVIGINVNDFARKTNESEKDSLLGTACPNDVAFLQSAERCDNKCNDSLHQSTQLLSQGNKNDCIRSEDVENVSFTSAISTQSAFISTQKKSKMESEVMKLRAEINALEELKRKKAVEKTPVQKSVGENVNMQTHSIELFSTAPSQDLPTCSDGKLIPVPSLSENKENLYTKQTGYGKVPIPKRKYMNERTVIVCTGLSVVEVTKVRHFASKICGKNSQVLSIWDPSVSHIIVHTNEEGETERTLKYLYGVATGSWIVSYDWVVESLKQGKRLREDSYEALDCTGLAGPHRGRTLTRHVFDGCQLCLIPPFSNLSLLQVEDLVSNCGAEIVHEVTSFKDKPGMKMVVLNSADSDEQADNGKFNGYVGVTYDWLIDCIGMASRISIMPYIVGNPVGSQISKSCIPTALLCETQNFW